MSLNTGDGRGHGVGGGGVGAEVLLSIKLPGSGAPPAPISM